MNFQCRFLAGSLSRLQALICCKQIVLQAQPLPLTARLCHVPLDQQKVWRGLGVIGNPHQPILDRLALDPLADIARVELGWVSRLLAQRNGVRLCAMLHASCNRTGPFEVGGFARAGDMVGGRAQLIKQSLQGVGWPERQRLVAELCSGPSDAETARSMRDVAHIALVMLAHVRL